MVVRRIVVRGERETNQQIRVLNLNRRPNINSRPARLFLCSTVDRALLGEEEREVPPRSVAKPGKRPTPPDEPTFLSRFCAIQWRPPRCQRHTYTRLICGTGWRLSDIYDCRSRNRNTAVPGSPLLIALKSPPVPGNRFRTSERKKKDKSQRSGGGDGGGGGDGEGETLWKRESFFARGASITDN